MEEVSNPIQNNQYSLSIRFNLDGFYLSVLDISNTLISAKKVSIPIYSTPKAEIAKIIEREADGLLDYQNIRLICELDGYIFVPNALFEKENEADYFLFEHKLDKNDCIISNNISSWETVNVFTIPISLKEALNQLFPNSIIEHHLSYFLTDKIKSRNEESVQIWVKSKIMDVVVITGGNLQLINSFSFNTPEDFTYYTLNIFEQLSLDIESCKVKLYNTEGNNELQRLLQKYVKQLTVIS
ncbi:MAG: DUF3822 family protein [Paludibacter sp.]